jgi:hypothetical protein
MADQNNRAATQEFTIRHILICHCGETLTPDNIDRIAAEMFKEMREGPTAWAFSLSSMGKLEI